MPGSLKGKKSEAREAVFVTLASGLFYDTGAGAGGGLRALMIWICGFCIRMQDEFWVTYSLCWNKYYVIIQT